MYKLITIIAFLIMTGCASNQYVDSRNTNLQCEDTFWSGCRESSHDIENQYHDKFSKYQLITSNKQKIEIEPNYDRVAYPKAEAMNLKTGEKFHFGHTIMPRACTPRAVAGESVFCPKNFVKEFCEDIFGKICVISRVDSEIYYTDLDDYNFKTEQKRLAKIKKEKEKQLAYEMQKQDAFNKLYLTCTGYGFQEQNAIASCIQQEIFNEKKLAILKEQQLAQLQYTNNQQTKEKEETGFWLQVLEGVAENLADPNTWENARQNAEIQRLKNQQRRTIPKICSGTSCN